MRQQPSSTARKIKTMPSGFTYKVENGEMTDLNEFVWKCARGMGALDHMHEDGPDIPINFSDTEPVEHCEKNLEHAKLERDALDMLSADQMRRHLEERYQSAHSDTVDCYDQWEEENGRYQAMLDKVQAWEPPTKEHEGFKQFMIGQLESSMHPARKEPPKQAAPDWGTEEKRLRDGMLKDIGYYEKHLAKAKERNQERMNWLTALDESVPRPARLVAGEKKD